MVLNLNADQRNYFYNELRDARAEVLRDSENFTEIVLVLERLGSFLNSGSQNLNAYRLLLQEIAQTSATYDLQNDSLSLKFEDLFRLVKDARNDAVHVGARARHAAGSAIQLSLIMEDGLMSKAETLREFMVTDPVIAEMWQPLNIIRYKMLANSFSFLPVLDSTGQWSLVSDTAIAKFLRGISNSERSKRLATTLDEAISTEGLQLLEARNLSVDTKLTDAIDELSSHPILLHYANSPNNLVGLVTAFDLL